MHFPSRPRHSNCNFPDYLNSGVSPAAPKLLKGFQKVSIGAGACAGVGFPLKAKDLQIWDVTAQAWKLVPGAYTVLVGSTSADIRLTGSLTVTA